MKTVAVSKLILLNLQVGAITNLHLYFYLNVQVWLPLISAMMLWAEGNAFIRSF